MKHYFLTALLLLSAIYVTAQSGSISGTIRDKEMNNEPLPFANAFIKGTTKGTTTDMDGNFVIENLSPGTYTLVFSFVGYETLEKNNVIVEAGKETKVDAVLGTGSVSLEEVILEVQTNRENESVLLLEQKKAVVAKQAIGAKELSRKGVSDAQGAVTKISGVSQQEGVKNVFVRGLGDRYNSTTLNGFPIPSEDPEYKNISLGFFGTDIIQNIGVDKVFSAGGIGDVSGANIDIVSKELSGDSALQLDLSLGVNSQVLGADNFLKQEGVDYFGFSNKKYPGDDTNSFNFTNKLTPTATKTPFNYGYGVSGGKKIYLGDNPLSLFFVGSYDTDYSFTDEIIRKTNTDGTIYLNQTGKKYSQNINQLALVNAKYRTSKQNKLEYTFMIIHNNNQYVADYIGTSDRYADNPSSFFGFMRRQQNNDNLLLVNQLNTNWKLSKKTELQAGISYNKVTGDEPDRRINNLTRDDSTGKFFLTGGSGEHGRYNLSLDENDFNIKTILSQKIKTKNEEDRISYLRVGYNGRIVTDNFSAAEYIFTKRLYPNQTDIESLNLDNFFNQEALTTNKIELDHNLDFYNVFKNIHSGFADITYQINSKIVANLGLSLDNIDLQVDYDVLKGTNVGSTSIKKTFLLPNINIKYDIAEKHSLRFGASKTYTLPQSKEISPYTYISATFKSQGNKDLQPSINYNIDLKWDHYMSNSELFSISLFQKYIENPIARIEENSAGGYLTYSNISESAIVLGVELEVRKNLYTSENNEKKLSMGLNASYIHSQLDFKTDNTEKRSALEGAAPFLGNFDISYSFKKINSSLVMNYFSDRIYTIGTLGFEDIIEKGVAGLDFVTSFNLSEKLSIKGKASNLLNPTYELKRKSSSGSDIVLNSYKKGVNVSLGISYEF